MSIQQKKKRKKEKNQTGKIRKEIVAITELEMLASNEVIFFFFAFFGTCDFFSSITNFVLFFFFPSPSCIIGNFIPIHP